MHVTKNSQPFRQIQPKLCNHKKTAAAVTFIAFLLSFSHHITVTLIASLFSFLAAFLTLIAFAIDIALYVFVKHQMGKLTGVIEHTNTAPGAPPSFAHTLSDHGR